MMARLDEICSLNMGQSPDSSSYNDAKRGVPFFQGNADFGIIHPTARVWCDAPTKIAHDGDILISVRAPIGALNIADTDCCIGRGLAALTVNESLCRKEYLWYAIASKVDELNSKGTGSTFKAISKRVLAETEIPLTSLERQTHIADALDLLTRIISLRKQQLSKLDELVKSRFIEMFGDPNNNPIGWKKTRLSECLTSIDNGKSFVCDSEPRIGEKPAVLKLSAATYGYYQPHENKAMLDDTQFVPSAEVRKGDLLFTRKNTPELVGMSAFVYETPPNLMMPDLIFRLNTRANCNKVFLWKIINLDLFRANVTALSSGSAKSMSNISKERLMGLEIILPPIELQNEFAIFVEQIDKSKFEIQKSLEKLETLKKALMQKYFG